MELAEYGLSQSDGASFDDTGHHSSDSISFSLYLEDEFFHFFRLRRVGAADRIGLYQVEVVCGIVLFKADRAYL